jgi:hypothetical protein
MNHLKYLCLYASVVFCLSAQAQYKIEVLDTNSFQLGERVILSKTSFRGLSVVNDQTIWVSGSRGTIARSIDGGKTFQYQQLKGYEQSDFRDIEAFDDKRAIIMSSGTPAYILKTVDGGQTWKQVYKNIDTTYFLDAMDFWDDQRGMLVGDPINGHFVLLQTNDGGETWQELDSTKTPKAMEGEAVFAASGTSLRCWGKSEFGFVTGGTAARLFFDYGRSNHEKEHENWLSKKTYIQEGSNPQGAFSFSLIDKKYLGLIIVGGDYVKDSSSQINSSLIFLNGHHDFKKFNDTRNYKSCVETFIYSDRDKNKRAIAVGTNGIEVFQYFEWKTISYEPFHVVRKAKKGKSVFLAGPKGKIGKLIY